MKRWAGLCLISMLTAINAHAIEAAVAYTPFYLPGDGQPFIEINWQVNPASLRFMQEANTFVSKIRTDITVKNDSALLAEDHFILQTIPTATLEAAKQQNITDLHRYMAAFGTITVQIKLTDLRDTTNTFNWKQQIDINGPFNKQPFYSGIQLLDTFYNTTEKSVFFKNDKFQLPLSANFLDDYRHSLKFYAELYQSNLVSKDEYPLVQWVYVSKRPHEGSVYGLQQEDTVHPGAVLPYIGSFNIDALPSGNYYLNIDLRNNLKKTIASSNVFFQRSNPDPVVATDTGTTSKDSVEKVNIFDLSKTFVSKYNIAQLKAILKMITPISTPVEAENIHVFQKRPDLMYMQYFVYNFWSSRNKKDPKKAWDEYADKVREVNKLFGRHGYETDRGYVYLKYGKPTERIIVQNEQGSLPYEVWQYNTTEKMSNALFLFYMPQNMVSDMLLLHSNVPGELRNTSWRLQLYGANTNSGHESSRAEQYFYR